MFSGVNSSSDRPQSSQYCNGPVSRKRPAALGLTKITFDGPAQTGAGLEPSNSARQTNSLGSGISAKRQRDCNLDSCFDNCLSDLIDGTPLDSSGRDCSSNVSYGSLTNFNNYMVGCYQLVGAGKEFTAFHVEEKYVKTCTVIDHKDFQKVLALEARLNEADKYWKYEDLEEMREFLLPSETEILTDASGKMFMFSPWHHGSLQDKIRASRLLESEVRNFFIQILRCVAFCHSIGVVMRDFKMRKFVFTRADMNCLRLRDIFDLHICENINDDRISGRRSCPAYVAPEILIKGVSSYAGRPADVWALGVLLYAMFFGCCPFYGSTLEDIFSRIFKVKFSFPKEIAISRSARILIVGILRKDPSARPTADELLHLPWIATDLNEIEKSILSTPFSRPISVTTKKGSIAINLASLTCIDEIFNDPSTLQHFEVEDDDHVVPSPSVSSESHAKPILNKRLHSIVCKNPLGVIKLSQQPRE